MLEIFITVVAAVVVGGILLKFWRPILSCIIAVITMVITLVIYVPVTIFCLPAKLILACLSGELIERAIVCLYEQMLSEADSVKDMEEGHKKIRRMQAILQRRKEREHNKQVKKLLEEAKWVL